MGRILFFGFLAIAWTANCVLGTPVAPSIVRLSCQSRHAIITWRSVDHTNFPLIKYNIEYSTSLAPNIWNFLPDNEVGMSEQFPSIETLYSIDVPMPPWSMYSFRVVADFGNGLLLRSEQSDICVSKAEIPYKNPDGVNGSGTTPTNLVISWKPMSLSDQNGPGFHYIVYWKRDKLNDPWNLESISDWQQDQFIIENQPTFTRFQVKVIAVNEVGVSNATVFEQSVYSGEGSPTGTPANFSVIQTSSTWAILRWDPVSQKSVNGHFKGYKIEVWSADQFSKSVTTREIFITNLYTSEIEIDGFQPNTNYSARISVCNNKFDGSVSNAIEIKTQLSENSVQTFEAFPLGSTAFLLRWTKSKPKLNSTLIGYKIIYEEVDGVVVLSKRERVIESKEVTHIKLNGLNPSTKYRLSIIPLENTGEGERYTIEATTNQDGSLKPDPPSFNWEESQSEGAVLLNWLPQLNGHPGSHFYIKYRVKNKGEWVSTNETVAEDYCIVDGLLPGEFYEFVVISVDGEFATESQTQEIRIQKKESYTCVWKYSLIGIGVILVMILCIVLLKLCKTAVNT